MRVENKCCHGDALGPQSTRLKICVSMRAGEVGTLLVLPPVGRRTLRPGSHRPIRLSLCRNSSAASIFSEQTERELNLLLKTLRCYAFETVSVNRARSQSKPVIQLVQWKYAI